MRAAGDHVHHRQREKRRQVGAQRLPERQPPAPGGRDRAGHGGREHGVGAEPREVRRPVERAKSGVDRLLIEGVAAHELRADLRAAAHATASRTPFPP